MRGLALGGAAVITLILGLACGGAFNEAMAEQVEDKANEMAGKVGQLPDGAEKARLMAVIEGMRANKAEFGIVDIATLEVEFDQALRDGAVDDAEVSSIEQKFAEAIAP